MNNPTRPEIAPCSQATPEDIVGHKTFSNQDGTLRHEPLTRAEADALWEQVERAKAKRAADMPDEQAALNRMWEGYYRLKELGWKEAIYCPKDGSMFLAIEPGSTGIFPCNYDGEWPDGRWWVYAEGDSSPSHPCLWKPMPEEK